MDGKKMTAVQELCTAIETVAAEKGYSVDFSGLNEGKGTEFKMNCAFSKMIEDKQESLFAPRAEGSREG